MSLPDLDVLILLVHTFSTLYMMGLIWFVQVVHYPLKSHVGPQRFVDYQRLHVMKTGWVVGPPMLLEAASTLWLFCYPPAPFQPGLTAIGLVVLLAIWLTTALFSVPAHNRLSTGFDVKPHRILVQTNWLRTIGWSVRGCLALYMLSLLL